jgi:hypothetical protein
MLYLTNREFISFSYNNYSEFLIVVITDTGNVYRLEPIISTKITKNWKHDWHWVLQSDINIINNTITLHIANTTVHITSAEHTNLTTILTALLPLPTDITKNYGYTPGTGWVEATGGSGTIQTDNVTIEGDGSALSKVRLKNLLDGKYYGIYNGTLYELSDVAISNDYNDLDNLPAIPAAQIQSDWNQANNVLLDFIKNKPTIPADTGDLTNGAGFITGADVPATETDPIFSASEAASFVAGDKLKLDGIEAGANNYTHPATHPLSIIDPTATAADTPIAASEFHFWDTVNLLWKYITWANIATALGLAITAGKTLTVTDDTTLNGGTHSGNNSGDQVGDGVTITGAGTIADPFVSAESTGIQTIVDENGNDMPDEFKLKVKGGIATDDAGVKIDIDVQHYPQQFRLTLETGVPVSTTVQTAKTVIYLTQYLGGKCTIYDGTDWITYQLTTDLSINLTDSQTGITTNGSKVITGLTDTSQLVVGMEVTGTGIAAASTIASIDSSTQITMNNNATADGTVTITFKVPASKAFDIYLIKGTSAPELRMVFWTDLATPITNSLVNGMEVSPTDNTWLYVGSGGTITTAGQITMSATILLLKNKFNIKTKRVYRTSTTSHTYNNSTSRKWNNDNSTEIVILLLQETITIGHQSAAFDASSAYGGLQIGYSIVGVAVTFCAPQILTSFNATLSSFGIINYTKGVYNFYVGERVFSGTVNYYNTILSILVEF